MTPRPRFLRFSRPKATGAKILEVNNDSLHESIRVAGVTALNYGLVPASQLEEVGKLMNYTGDFAILSAATTSIFQNQWIAGMKKLLAVGSEVPATCIS